jgi:predicted ATP-dependent endonuclease of OLD family
LIFNIDGNDRALDSVGTGYEHIFLLVAASVVYPNDLLCVEEPEVHMHPRLQRRLAAYLDTIGNQVLISTHSPTLIDALAGTVFRLSMIENSTRIESRVGEELLHVFDDLGYRASDLLQTNFVIWVEGPSDRIYVNAWIREVDADLVEGIHFRVMFYGGSLLSHLTVDRDPEDTSERIYLPQLNQRFMILADSDRRSADDPLKARVERIVQEAEARSHGSVWVTAGRTIENYLSPSDMKSAIEGAHPSATANEEYDQYGDALEATSAASTSFEVDKVKVAQHAVTSGVRLDYLNLRKSVEWLVGLIKDANN